MEGVSTRVQVSVKSPPESIFSSTPQRSTANSADPTQHCCPLRVVPPTLWGGNIISGRFVLSTCADKEGCGNSSVVLQLGDRDWLFGITTFQSHTAPDWGRSWRGCEQSPEGICHRVHESPDLHRVCTPGPDSGWALLGCCQVN